MLLEKVNELVLKRYSEKYKGTIQTNDVINYKGYRYSFIKRYYGWHINFSCNNIKYEFAFNFTCDYSFGLFNSHDQYEQKDCNMIMYRVYKMLHHDSY